MKIQSVQTYMVDLTGSDFGPDAKIGERELIDPVMTPAHPMGAFPEYRHEIEKWRGSFAYAPFVVRVETESGETGFAINHGGGEVSAVIVEKALKRFVEGMDPFDTNLIWDQMHRSQLATGQGGFTYMAMSAIDLALWDLKGQITGLPVYQLLGGRVKQPLPVYITTFPQTMKHMADQGFAAVKLSVPFGPSEGQKGVDDLAALVEEARDLFGWEIDLALECYMGWDAKFFAEAVERLRPFRLAWVEDPLPADVPVARYRELRESHRVRLGVGNLMWGEGRFYELITASAVDVVQPELQWMGGVTAALRVAAVARGRGLETIPHWAGSYSYHFTATLPEAPYAEYLAPGDGTKVVAKAHGITGEPPPSDGVIDLGDAPGFGLEVDEDVLVPLEEFRS